MLKGLKVENKYNDPMEIDYIKNGKTKKKKIPL